MYSVCGLSMEHEWTPKYNLKYKPEKVIDIQS